MRKTLAALIMAGIATPALAALPPQYQRERELTAVISAVAAAGYVVDSVAYADGAYRVVAGDCTIEVLTPTVPPAAGSQPVVGPRQFTVEMGEPQCGAGAPPLQ